MLPTYHEQQEFTQKVKNMRQNSYFGGVHGISKVYSILHFSCSSCRSCKMTGTRRSFTWKNRFWKHLPCFTKHFNGETTTVRVKPSKMCDHPESTHTTVTVFLLRYLLYMCCWLTRIWYAKGFEVVVNKLTKIKYEFWYLACSAGLPEGRIVFTWCDIPTGKCAQR